MKTFKGTLELNRNGNGIIKSKTIKKKIHVNKKDLNFNFSGMKVSFVIIKETEKNLYAKITSDPDLKNREFFGIVHHKYDNSYLVYVKIFGKNNLILCDNKFNIPDNNFVKIKIKKIKNKKIYGKIKDNIGSFNDNAALTKFLINEHKLVDKFPQKVLMKTKKAINRYNQDYEKQLKKRKDLKGLRTFTIDPQRARDLDDAIAIQKKNDGYKLYVHIADVSYFVKLHNSIDKEAAKRSFSVYLPEQVIRMLPAELSEKLCSLLPDTDKFAVTTEIDLDKNGKVIDYDIYKSVIRSRHKYAYEDVYSIITKNKPDKYRKELDLLHELSLKLKTNRLKLPENRMNKKTKEIELSYSDFSHAMIEEAMILNNILAAKYLASKNLAYPSRFHQAPLLETNIYNLHLMNKLNNLNLQNIDVEKIQKVIDTSVGNTRLTNLYLIRRMLTKAKYDITNNGHWALNLKYYSHFTSPIRRYPDLISHRLIFGEKIALNNLEKMMSVVNENELRYQKINFQVEDIHMIRHINDYSKYYINKEFESIIIDIRNPVITLFIPDIFWIKKINIKDFKQLDCDEDRLLINGNETFVGNKIKVKLNKISIPFLELYFDLA